MKLLKVSQLSAHLLTTILFLLVAHQPADAELRERLILRRQSGESPEKEGTTTAASTGDQGQQANGQSQQPPRLYPDLPHPPQPGSGGFVPPPPQFPAPHHYSPNHGQTPFVPFGLQMPGSWPNDLSARQRQPLPLPPQPRPMTPAERLQSQSFSNGLGRRLLSMVGIDTSNSSMTESSRATPNDDTFKALHNSTVLQQLNRGVQSIYDNLSRMYNSTIQEQLSLLQERYKKETENSTNPWQQRMAQQVPQFFKMMASRVEGAQSNLNRIWQQVTQANNGTLNRTATSEKPRSFFNNMFDPSFGPNGPAGRFDDNTGFFNQIGRSFGFGSDQADLDDPTAQSGHKDFTSQLREFWHNQVQPQVGLVRSQIARVWRDLTASGAFTPQESLVRSRANGNNLGSAKNESSSDFVDDILKGIDISGPEYTLIEAKSDPQSSDQGQGDMRQKQQQQQNGVKSNVSNQMQNGLIAMQRELNQLWNGLSNSLQGALKNVRNSMNPGRPFGPMDTASTNSNRQEADPAENEIDGKIKDLSKLQKDTDIVYDVVQLQQQAQQRQSFGDRFRNFINSVDIGNVDQLPGRFGDSMTRFGNAVGDFWQQIPGRWDSFVQNMRHQDPKSVANARLTSPGTTNKPSTSTTTTTESSA